MKNKLSNLAALCFITLPSIGLAQTAPQQGHETVIVIGKSIGYAAKNSVTATKTDTALIDVPQSINVIGRKQLKDQAHHSIGDVLRYTSGVTIGQGEGNRDQITLRGQNTTADFFLDGVRDDVQYYRSLYNIERVEVLKGPYSMIFGRGGGGGIINRVQKAPIASKEFIEIGLSANSFGAYDIGFDYNQPTSENGALRVNGFYEKFANHRKFYDGERYAINPYFAFKLNEDWTAAASYEYVYDDRVADRGIPSFAGKPLEISDSAFFGTPDINNSNINAQIAKFRLDGELTNNLRTTNTILIADYDKSYANVYANGPATSQFGTVAMAAYIDPTKRRNFIAQSNIIWDFDFAGMQNKVLFGIEHGEQTTKNSRKNGVLSANNLNLANVVFPTVSFTTLARNTKSDVKFSSIYAQSQISIGSFWDLIFGLRFDSFEIKGQDLISAPARDFARKDEEVSPRIGILFKPTENARLYASYSKSFLPRSGDQFASLSISQQNLAPEEFANSEFGVKWDIRPNLSVTAAIFELIKSNATTPNPVNPAQTINVGETKTSGYEMAIAGQITEAWQVNGSFSHQDAALKGNSIVKLAQVPENQFALWNRYNLSKAFGFGIGYIYQSEQYATINTSSATTQLPSFDRIDAALYYNFENGIAAQVNFENLANTKYYSDAHNNNNITPGAPLNARISISRRF